MPIPSNRFPALPAAAFGVLALLATMLVIVHPASAQSDTTHCAAGVAVPDAANNPGLVSDCEALLEARDTLAGTATLNWSADTPISDWKGVTAGGTPQRVMELSLNHRGLTGEIPKELGNLSNLQLLELTNNQLSGRIPPELGSLSNLRGLELSRNQLTGQIPARTGQADQSGVSRPLQEPDERADPARTGRHVRP